MGRDFWLLFGTGLFLNMGLNFSNGMLALYAQSIGCAAASIGFITGIAFAGSLAFKLVSGPLLDAFNRKVIVAVAMVAMGLAYLGYANSTNEAMLVCSSLLRGSAQAFTATGCMIVVSDCLPKEGYARGIGIYSLSMNICHAVGPFASLNLALLIGFDRTYVIAAVFMVAGIVLLFSTKVASRGSSPLSLSTALRHVVYPPALGYAAIGFCFQAANMVIVHFLAIFGVSRGIPQQYVGLFFVVYALVLVLVRPQCGRIVDKHGLLKVMVPTLVVFGVSFVLLAFASDLVTLLVAAPVVAIGISCMPLVQACAMRQAPDEARGAATSTVFIGNDLGSFLGPYLCGIVAAQAGYSAMWLAAIVPVAAAIVLSLALAPRMAR